MRCNITRAAPATTVVLDLLAATAEGELNAGQFAYAGVIMGFGEAPMRVALTRLVKLQKLIKTGRASYALHPSQQFLVENVTNWRRRFDRVSHWDGDWVAVLEPRGLTRFATAHRRHARALSLRGFRSWRPAVAVRPGNLRGDSSDLADELTRLGLSDGCELITFRPSNPEQRDHLPRLWETARLADFYDSFARRLKSESAVFDREDDHRAARESLALGREAIRQILRDPMLPEELMPRAHLAGFAEQLDQYQSRSLALWRSLMGFSE